MTKVDFKPSPPKEPTPPVPPEKTKQILVFLPTPGVSSFGPGEASMEDFRKVASHHNVDPESVRVEWDLHRDGYHYVDRDYSVSVDWFCYKEANNPDYDRYIKDYDKNMKRYKEKYKVFQRKLEEYKRNLQIWEDQKRDRKIAELEAKLKKLKGS